MIIFLITIYFCCKLFATGEQDLVEHGRKQYQLLKERENLPQYGSCWKQGIEHLERGCKYLSEDSQSEVALHLTNCFLVMSGHETYNCESDKKWNLRAICISNMSDRAFNVYTEFYTHIQNICGFLQGHFWQEIIAENTMTVGRKLKETAKNQEGLLEAQKESLKLQEKMLQHGRILENVLEDLFLSFKTHQDILQVLSDTVKNLQNWIVGEMSWFDSIIFYTVSVFLVFIFTSSKKTSRARFFIFILLVLNFLVERLISSIYIFLSDEDTSNMHSTVYNYIWFSRYAFIVFSVILLIYIAINENDPFRKQYELLCLIQEQNSDILSILKKSNYDKLYANNINEVIKNVNESANFTKLEKNVSNQTQQEYFSALNQSQSNSTESTVVNTNSYSKHSKVKREQDNVNSRILNETRNNFAEKYHLRSCSRASSREPLNNVI